MSASPAAILSADRYADWKAPSGDSEIVLWPDYHRFQEETRGNHHRLGRENNVRLLGVPLSLLRRDARAWIGHTKSDQPLIATGHQTELWHPGVWVKNAVIDAAARVTGGQAYHFAVDTDTPKHLLVRWPGASMPITDDPRLSAETWAGMLDAATPAHISEIDRQIKLSSIKWPFKPMVFDVLDSMKRLALEQPRLSIAICNALHELDWSLGLRHHAMVCSPIWTSPPFLTLVAYVIANAGVFARDYNAALHAYRDEHGMKTDTRPMPDLFTTDESTELPFWLDNLADGHRIRPSVFQVEGRWVLKLVTGEEFTVGPTEDGASAAERLGRFLATATHRISPRALTLTMFLRLFVADHFVHGIGGGRYDQVLDKLVASHFGIEPPRFAVATATLLFPTAVHRQRACVPCVLQEGHQLKHRLLGQQKMRYVEQIARLPRRSRERSMVFAEMQSTLRTHWQTDPSLARWQSRLEQTRAEEQRDTVEFDRELFYAIQPRERLLGLVDRVSTFMK